MLTPIRAAVLGAMASAGCMLVLLSPQPTKQRVAGHVWTVKDVFRESDVVVLGWLVGAAGDYGAESLTPRLRGAGTRGLHQCQLRIQTLEAIKSPRGQVDNVASTYTANALVAAEDCIPAPLVGKEQQLGVWFLRKAGQAWYTRLDGDPWFFVVPTAPNDAREKLNAIEDPSTKLAYVLLSPAFGRRPDSLHISTQLLGLCGWEKTLTAFRYAYEDSSEYDRDKLSLLLPQNAMCVARAKKASWMIIPDIHTHAQPYPFLDPAQLADHEARLLGQYSGNTLVELRRMHGFTAPEELRDWLVHYACVSAPKLRRRTRELLRVHFAYRERDLPCVPCE